MAEKLRRNVGGRSCEVQLSFDCGGNGWVVTVRHEERVIATGLGDSREEVLNRVLNELRQRFQGENLVLTCNPELFLDRGVPLGEPLKAARGKLPPRGWLTR